MFTTTTLTAVIIFGASLIGVVLLFSLRSWEMRRGSIIFSGVRTAADTRALQLKAVLMRFGLFLSYVPPTAVVLVRFGIHQAALGAARLSRGLEAGAYRLADRVSHRHRFERKETRSQFLKDVSEAKQNSDASSKETPSQL